MEQGEADIDMLPHALCVKELHAAIQPTQGVFAAVEGWEGEFVVAQNANSLH
jgi:hypothetical protein